MMVRVSVADPRQQRKRNWRSIARRAPVDSRISNETLGLLFTLLWPQINVDSKLLVASQCMHGVTVFCRVV